MLNYFFVKFLVQRVKTFLQKLKIVGDVGDVLGLAHALDTLGKVVGKVRHESFD